MSEVSSPSATSPTERGGLGGVAIVAIALGAMLLAGLAAWLLVSRAAPIDGEARVLQHFGAGVDRVGMRVRAAQRLPDGVELVALQDPSAAQGDEPVVTGDTSAVLDRTKVDLGPTGTAPREALLVFVPTQHWERVRKEHFERVRWRDLGELPPSGGTQTAGEGKLTWRGYEVAWVHERTWDAAGSFRDAVRLDVSLPEQPASLLLTWPKRARADADACLKFLERLTP